MNPHNSLLHPNTLKSRFTKGFLRALRKINSQRSTSCSYSSPKEIFQQYNKVRTAADKSLACAVGSRRSWSRAMLGKIRNKSRGQRRHALARRICSINQDKKIKGGSKEKVLSADGQEAEGFGEANELRKLVPGGEAMDLCPLLEEAAHYIKCLSTQVQVMRRIADLSST